MQPFNAATLFCDMLTHRLQGDNQALALQLHQSLHHAEELLTMLLEMTRLEAGNLPVNRQQVALHDVLQPVVENARVVAQNKGIALHYLPSSAILHTDRKLLGRIVQNILSNAVRYTNEGHILIGCRRRSGSYTAVEPFAEPYIELWIADTGVGIPKDKRDDIFREFHQLNMAGDNPGLGLGLAIVERMCRLLDIPLTLQSDVGRGTCFRLSFPVSRWEKYSTNEPANLTSEQFLRGVHILVIDNDEAVLAAMCGLLSDWGATTSRAVSIETLELTTKPDILVVDYHLDQQRTGIEVLQFVRDHFHDTNIPAIMNSADPNEEIREQAIGMQASFIPKPVKPAALKRLLKRFLNQR